MIMYLWKTNRLALALSRGELSADEKFRYLVANYCIWAAAGYIGSLVVTAPSGWLFWYEGVLVLVVTYFGLQRCREKYQRASDDRLLEHCVVLGVPLSLKLCLFSWLAYVTFAWGLRRLLAQESFTFSPESLPTITLIMNGILTFYPFLIVTVGTLIYYLRLAAHLETVAEGLSLRRMRYLEADMEARPEP